MASTGLAVAAQPATSPTATAPPAVATPAPRPPYVYTGSAAQVTTTAATVRAKVDPHGLPTEYRFEYGPSTTYGAVTPSASAGDAATESLLALTISSLQPNTTYHYRIVATNSAGTTAGQDAAFTTRKVPLSLTLTAAPSPAVFGAALAISGVLAGTGNAGIPVVLQGNPFPYTHGFHDLTSAEPTDATGAFSFPLAGLLESTQLRVATGTKPTIVSTVATELVTVKVTLHARPARRRGFVRLSGVVTPSVRGARVAFEWRSATGTYAPVSGTLVRVTGGLSHFARTVRLRRRGLYRAFVQVASGAQISGSSRPVAIR